MYRHGPEVFQLSPLARPEAGAAPPSSNEADVNDASSSSNDVLLVALSPRSTSSLAGASRLRTSSCTHTQQSQHE